MMNETDSTHALPYTPFTNGLGQLGCGSAVCESNWPVPALQRLVTQKYSVCKAMQQVQISSQWCFECSLDIMRINFVPLESVSWFLKVIKMGQTWWLAVNICWTRLSFAARENLDTLRPGSRREEGYAHRICFMIFDGKNGANLVTNYMCWTRLSFAARENLVWRRKHWPHPQPHRNIEPFTIHLTSSWSGSLLSPNTYSEVSKSNSNIFSGQLLLSQKLRYLRGSRFPQCFILSTTTSRNYKAPLWALYRDLVFWASLKAEL